jgi:dienelactone hydrolase
MLVMPGDPRIPQFAALGGAIGALLALPTMIVAGPVHGLALLVVSVAGFASAGLYSLRVGSHPEDVPESESTLRLAVEVSADELVLVANTLRTAVRSGSDCDRVRKEIDRACELFEAAGWQGKPAGYHEIPPPLIDPKMSSDSARGLDFERMEFESAYAPREHEPGRERWLGRTANRTAHAWVLRHRGEPRPWLIAVHGYQMGHPLLDFSAFSSRWLHKELGLNVLFPVLPLHGPRKAGWVSGDGYLTGDILDTIHAEAQAIWDMRRMLGWLREQDAPSVGVFGISLGGYNAALLASLEPNLACVIAGIPAVDLGRLFFRHSSPLQLSHAETHGIDQATLSDVLRVVSPLAFTPQVPRDRRFLFAATEDRMVPADQVRDLWQHWEQPRIEWYPGAHVTFAAHPRVRSLVETGLRLAALVE